MSNESAQTLRALIAGEEMVVVPGVYDALSATLTEQAGFPAAYVSGAAASVSLLGRPDIGLMTATDVAAHLARLSGATSLPLIADADTGYGNELNVRHTVETYIRAGAAALHVEDQVFPKRCGHLSGKSVIDRDDAVSKVRAAVRARGDDDLVVIGRTDALATHGIDEAVERGRRFADAGADMVFVDAVEDLDQLRRIASAIKVPLVVNVMANSRTPVLSHAEYADLGYRLAIYPIMGLAAASAAVQSALASLRDTGLPPLDAAGPGELFETVGISEWLRWPDDGPRPPAGGPATAAVSDVAAPREHMGARR